MATTELTEHTAIIMVERHSQRRIGAHWSGCAVDFARNGHNATPSLPFRLPLPAASVSSQTAPRW